MSAGTGGTLLCPTCGSKVAAIIPPEPTTGTWMKDRHGGTTMRQKGGWGQPGFYPSGKWEAMWQARGPYVECGPWGAELERSDRS